MKHFARTHAQRARWAGRVSPCPSSSANPPDTEGGNEHRLPPPSPRCRGWGRRAGSAAGPGQGRAGGGAALPDERDGGGSGSGSRAGGAGAGAGAGQGELELELEREPEPGAVSVERGCPQRDGCGQEGAALPLTHFGCIWPSPFLSGISTLGLGCFFSLCLNPGALYSALGLSGASLGRARLR